jgi:hypothetical protein
MDHKHSPLACLPENENNSFGHYNIQSASEVNDETPYSRTYISSILHHLVRCRKNLMKNTYVFLFRSA